MKVQIRISYLLQILHLRQQQQQHHHHYQRQQLTWLGMGGKICALTWRFGPSCLSIGSVTYLWTIMSVCCCVGRSVGWMVYWLVGLSEVPKKHVITHEFYYWSTCPHTLKLLKKDMLSGIYSCTSESSTSLRLEPGMESLSGAVVVVFYAKTSVRPSHNQGVTVRLFSF